VICRSTAPGFPSESDNSSARVRTQSSSVMRTLGGKMTRITPRHTRVTEKSGQLPLAGRSAAGMVRVFFSGGRNRSEGSGSGTEFSMTG
jgi:hypothetical protein